VLLWFQLKSLWSARQAAMPAPSPVAQALPREPPEPRLQTAPQDDLKALRAAETIKLETYGWIDRKGGVVRIPVERSMELLVEEARR
jgi:hypothetical protein